MFAEIINGIGNLCIALLIGMGLVALYRLNERQIKKRENSMQFYLFKISRVTGHSEYDVFCKSAEDWPVATVAKDRIDADFKDYLNRQVIPPYVHHFVRENKHHIDELNLPRF